MFLQSRLLKTVNYKGSTVDYYYGCDCFGIKLYSVLILFLLCFGSKEISVKTKF